jgi:hypothetical protein
MKNASAPINGISTMTMTHKTRAVSSNWQRRRRVKATVANTSHPARMRKFAIWSAHAVPSNPIIFTPPVTNLLKNGSRPWNL